ncbi:MAG: metallophosphoesterase [Candidatus Kapabacteria bacterium]|nr:metallophosphoesterase [Candidatus Kapabacteria bacterium]
MASCMPAWLARHDRGATATPALWPDVDRAAHHSRVAVVGDLQRTGPVETWRERNDHLRPRLIESIATDRPDALVLLGDMVFWGASEDDWSYFDDVMAPLVAKAIPTIPVLGNHEYYGSTTSAMNHVRSRFPHASEQAFMRTIDSVAWIVLNTNFDDIGRHAARTQLQWLNHMLGRLDADPGIVAVIVCGHHPPFTNSTVVSDDLILKRHFVPLFLQARKTTVWLSGHAHTYERFAVQGKQFIVSGGGGGPRQRVLPASARRHRDLYEGSEIRPLHYLIVERTAGAIVVSMRPLAEEPYRTPAFDMVTLPVRGPVPPMATEKARE